jgi:hypothetical protein
MILPSKKPESGQRGPLLGGEASLAKLKASLKKPSPVVKEEKMDTSAFQGRPYLKREEIRQWLRKDEIRKITNMPAKDRPALEKKLFDPKRFGIFIDPKEAGKVHKELKNFPTKSKQKYGIKSERERFKTLHLLKKFLGK